MQGAASSAETGVFERMRRAQEVRVHGDDHGRHFRRLIKEYRAKLAASA